MTHIDPNRVYEILLDCLFEEGEPTEPYVEVKAIQMTYRFHPERLESHRAEVSAMLDLLPLPFRSIEEGGGGGWSFLNACVERDPSKPDTPFEAMPIWTGFHVRVDELLSLGQGLDLVECQLPRKMWSAMPGGMPYYVVALNRSVRQDG
jgi:hypothetical protein